MRSVDASSDDEEERSNPIEHEHHAIFNCSGYTDAQEQSRDLSQSHTTIVELF